MRLLHLLLAAALSAPALAQTQPYVMAHRGFYMRKGFAPNTLESMVRAGELGADVTEFDVHMTKDKVLVVNHDATINGRTISESLYSEICDTRLDNGEILPTLDQVLNASRAFPAMRMAIELKPQTPKELDREIADLVVAEVRSKRLEDRVVYISFSLPALQRIHEVAPEATLSYLTGDKTPAELHSMGIEWMGYMYLYYMKHPEWVKEAHQLGMKVFAWTMNTIFDWQRMVDLGVDYLESDIPHLLIDWLREKRLR